jgi:hypothetical protein
MNRENPTPTPPDGEAPAPDLSTLAQLGKKKPITPKVDREGENQRARKKEAKEEVLRLLDLPKRPGGKRCYWGASLRAQSRKDRRRSRIFLATCKSWRCVPCCWRLQRGLGLHFGAALLAERRPLYAGTAEPSRWPADRKALARARADWVRVLGPDGQADLVATSPAAGGERVTPAWAVRSLGAALRRLSFEGKGEGRTRPASSSRAWALGKRAPSEWRRVGWVRTRDPGRIADALARHGIDARVRSLDESSGLVWGVSWVQPDGMTAEEAEDLRYELEGR